MKQGTSQHPKTLALARRLGIPRSHAIGLMVTLWEWSYRYVIRGDVGLRSNQDIADALDWSGDADQLIEALVNTGWLDRVQDPHRLVIHDIHEHAEDFHRTTLERMGLTWWDGALPRKHKRGENLSPRAANPAGDNLTRWLAKRVGNVFTVTELRRGPRPQMTSIAARSTIAKLIAAGNLSPVPGRKNAYFVENASPTETASVDAKTGSKHGIASKSASAGKSASSPDAKTRNDCTDNNIRPSQQEPQSLCEPVKHPKNTMNTDQKPAFASRNGHFASKTTQSASKLHQSSDAKTQSPTTPKPLQNNDLQHKSKTASNRSDNPLPIADIYIKAECREHIVLDLESNPNTAREANTTSASASAPEPSRTPPTQASTKPTADQPRHSAFGGVTLIGKNRQPETHGGDPVASLQKPETPTQHADPEAIAIQRAIEQRRANESIGEQRTHNPVMSALARLEQTMMENDEWLQEQDRRLISEQEQREKNAQEARSASKTHADDPRPHYDVDRPATAKPAPRNEPREVPEGMLDEIMAYETSQNARTMWANRLERLKNRPGAMLAIQDLLDEIKNRRSATTANAKGYNGTIENPARWLNGQVSRMMNSVNN